MQKFSWKKGTRYNIIINNIKPNSTIPKRMS